MNDETNNRFDLDRLRLDIGEVRAVVPEKIKKRRRQLVIFPWTWIDRLDDASGKTWRVAAYVRHLGWKNKGGPFKLANGMLRMDGVAPSSKLRALRDLERRGLIGVEWRDRKSPTILWVDAG
jgi:hypothetical protein